METPEQITKFLVGKSEKDVTRLLKFFERESMHERLDAEEVAVEQAKQFASESTDDLVRRLSGLHGRDKRKEQEAVNAELAKRDQVGVQEYMVKEIFNAINAGPVNMRNLQLTARDHGYTGDLISLINNVERIKIEQEQEANVTED